MTLQEIMTNSNADFTKKFDAMLEYIKVIKQETLDAIKRESSIGSDYEQIKVELEKRGLVNIKSSEMALDAGEDSSTASPQPSSPDTGAGASGILDQQVNFHMKHMEKLDEIIAGV